MRDLTKDELVILRGLSHLGGVAVGIFEVTQTQLAKKIIDANFTIRTSFEQSGLHFYDLQHQGEEHKVIRRAWIFDVHNTLLSDIRIYRPRTKNGDPRIWIGQLKSLMNPSPGDVLAIAQNGEDVVIVNLSSCTFASEILGRAGRILSPSTLPTDMSVEASDLLDRLSDISKSGPIFSTHHGDTAIGHALETRMGIAQNSSKEPDYNGIELKTMRTSAKSRSSLFAQVPDWSRSACKSSKEIVQKYGYLKDGLKRLYCSVSATKVNSQDLQLELDFTSGLLNEMYVETDGTTNVVTWEVPKLIDRLAQKHTQTFWIKAEEILVNGRTAFQLVSATHTIQPNVMAFTTLLADGTIELDHLIKETLSGSAREKGPLFKIWPTSLPALFKVEGEYTFV